MNKDQVLKELKDWCVENSYQEEIDADYRDINHTISKILNKGYDNFLLELWETNLDYIAEIEVDLYNQLLEEMEEEIGHLCKLENLQKEDVKEYLYDLGICPHVDITAESILRRDIIAYVTIYSNFDCTVSFDDIDTPETYYSTVYNLLKGAISREDMISEHSTIYGGSVLIFPFRIELKDYLELKYQFEKADKITIPKGSSFGFYSSFQGSSSEIAKTTIEDITLPIKYGPTKYDILSLEADLQNSYSLEDIGFDTDCFDEINIKIIDVIQEDTDE